MMILLVDGEGLTGCAGDLARAGDEVHQQPGGDADQKQKSEEPERIDGDERQQKEGFVLAGGDHRRDHGSRAELTVGIHRHDRKRPQAAWRNAERGRRDDRPRSAEAPRTRRRETTS